jgi:hypothetical protein
MEKPIVFLSHSAKNKRELIALKQLLDRKAVGFIDFFLSSDGESIPLGTNWVQRLNEALKKTKLMFVFVSREALESEWLLFESGYAYGNDIHVVPYCLPGAEMRHLPAPLKLLQAHNLHCAKDLNSLVKKCNEIFDTKIPEKFSAQEFSSVFRQLELPEERSKPAIWEALVREITAETKGTPNGAKIFGRLCERKKLDCFGDPTPYPNATWREITSAGVTLREESEWFDDLKRERVTGQNEYRYKFTLSPELFGLTAGLIDSWAKKLKISLGFNVEASFNFGVELEQIDHELTTKLFDSEIRALDADWFSFRDLRFSLALPRRSWERRDRHPHLKIYWVKRLSTVPIGELLMTLLSRQVLIIDDKDLSKRVFAKQ